MEKIRSFIAIELPPEIKRELSSLQRRLGQGTGNAVRWVDPAGIHLTLKFLGDVEADKIDRIGQALAEAVSSFYSFDLWLKGLGVFPGISSPRVVWVGVDGEVARLAQLQRQVEACVKPFGFDPEGRAFTPHLTLGRVREGASSEQRRELGRAVASVTYEGGSPFPATSVSLIRSQLTPQGAIYTILSEASLLPARPRSGP